MLAHFEWRREYMIDGIMDEDWSDLDSSGELVLSGLDKEGHSGWIWHLAKHDPKRCSSQRAARHLVCMMERAMLANEKHDQRINAVCDCSGVSPSNLDLPMLRIAIPVCVGFLVSMHGLRAFLSFIALCFFGIAFILCYA